MYFLDFFAGIGLFRLGLEQAGFICKGHCEIDSLSFEFIRLLRESGDNKRGQTLLLQLGLDKYVLCSEIQTNGVFGGTGLSAVKRARGI